MKSAQSKSHGNRLSKWLKIDFLVRTSRRNVNFALLIFLIVYILLSQLTRKVFVTTVHQPGTEAVDVKSITLKPGLKEMINSTEKNVPSMFNIGYLLQNKHLCSSSEIVDAAVMVYTATANFERRKIMRETWLNKTLLSNLGTTKFIFLLGTANEQELQSEIDKEFKQYGDILQGDFLDTYANLTLKGIMGLKWLSENCKNAKILIKADDDIVINVFRFYEEVVPEMKLHDRQVFCWRSARSIIFRGVRHKSYLPKNYFYGQHSYPLYCKGPFVFMSFDLVPLILKSASITPFLWLEDVYLYGLVMQNIPGISYKQYRKGYDFHLDIANVMECFNRTACEMFVAGVSHEGEMLPIWTSMLKQSHRI
ncbi:beta-1,3-galactosyltransferase 1-like [Ruditapes philippinarum]|uniref:beta-1,3-galactosyltransferase 1-like n=1 Tax=Ruditapes philippinarum TaxID=129788 RepID=UPI00295AC51C|nr:beta-1,3-galactosyltransferase 1-like [Ruditapes philippinarum]